MVNAIETFKALEAIVGDIDAFDCCWFECWRRDPAYGGGWVVVDAHSRKRVLVGASTAEVFAFLIEHKDDSK